MFCCCPFGMFSYDISNYKIKISQDINLLFSFQKPSRSPLSNIKQILGNSINIWKPSAWYSNINNYLRFHLCLKMPNSEFDYYLEAVQIKIGHISVCIFFKWRIQLVIFPDFLRMKLVSIFFLSCLLSPFSLPFFLSFILSFFYYLFFLLHFHPSFHSAFFSFLFAFLFQQTFKHLLSSIWCARLWGQGKNKDSVLHRHCSESNRVKREVN